jgi:hypothetical protein
VAEEGGAIRDRGCAAYVRGIVSVTVAMDVARRRRVRRVMRVVLTYPGGGTLVDVGQGEVARRGRTRSARSPRALLREELADLVRSRQALRAENGKLFFVRGLLVHSRTVANTERVRFTFDLSRVGPFLTFTHLSTYR